ncbi:DegT/DnrJ/EryC1/StrS family aminotransferase [Candidatus Saccharibacteria bacterium]|nr:DegT/DnrJ/EryC1/StrS family aminotransferase [Candidatus Saccharibacteria bacterium]
MKYFLGLSSQFSIGDVIRHTLAIGDEYQLPELRAFLAAHYGATFDHVAVYANGRTALNVAIKAVAPRGSKVIITSLTCYAVVQAVKSAGCVPIFADVNKETLHYGAKELEKAIQGETNVKAIIVQNNLGIPVDIAAIEKVANAHKLAIIEDLAHCAGVRYPDGREVGTVGRVAALSFGKGKSIDAVSGGAVVFTDPLDPPVKQPTNPPRFPENFRARFYPLFSLIIRGLYYIHPKIGRAFTAFLLKTKQIKRSADGVVDPKTRLTYWQCALALRQLRSMPHRGRKPLRDFYLVNDREEVLAGLEKKGYYFGDTWYDLPVAPKRYFAKADFHPDLCPVATELAEQIVNLPTWYDAAELRSAKRLILAHLVDHPDKDAESAEVPEDEMTEDEKRAKIKAERTARRQQLKAEKKSKKEKAKKQKADGAPDEEVITDDESEKSVKSKKPKKNAKEKLAAILESASKKVAETPEEKKEKKAEAKKKKAKAEEQKRLEKLAVLEEKSNILEAGILEPEEEEIDEDAAKIAAEQPAQPTQPAKISQVSPAPKPVATSSTGMRKAAPKLSDREKLKLELESGKKEQPSVL